MPVIAAHEVSIPNANQVIYNGMDTLLDFEIDAAREKLRTNDELIYTFERGLQGVALEMMARGFRVDIGEREKAIISTNKVRDDLERVLSQLVEAVQGSYNSKLPNSGKQLATLFYDHMNIKPITKMVDGQLKYPMGREVLEKLQAGDKWASPIIAGVLAHRDLSKALQVLETQIEEDGPFNWRWRCSYNIGGTKTGRWSSSKSPFVAFSEESQVWKQVGNNFQNITEEWRRIFIPDPGYKLYGIDKAQSESRDFGWFCGIIFGDWSYLDACESGDLHTAVTRLLYPEWAWTGNIKEDRKLAERNFYRHFTYRDASKRLGHATNYLGTPEEISRQVHIPLHLVKQFQERYFAAFPCIPRTHQWVAQQIQTERFLVNSFGRKRDFFDRVDTNDTLKAAVAYLFQSATGDCLNLGLWRLWKYMGTRVQILAQLHDAVYFQAKIPANDDEEQQLLRDARGLIEVRQRDPKSGRTMMIPGEVVGGFNWAHRFKLNDDGTKNEWNPKGLDGIRIAA